MVDTPEMQVQTYWDVLATWQPRYRLAPRGPPLYVKEAGETGFSFVDCEWRLTEESMEEGLLIFQRALEADKIWKDAQRQVEVAVAKAQILVAVPKVFKAKHIALTVCPETGDHVTMLQIAAIVARVSAVQSGKFVVEQRSKPGEQPHGWHLHFFIQTTYAPAKIKQFVQQKLASRGYTCMYHATPADENWLKKYMSGAKGNAEKDLKVQHDRILREQLNIPHIVDMTEIQMNDLRLRFDLP